MSVCGQSGHPEEESASEETGVPARDDYKQKPASKVVRVLTVLAYLLSVSLAAILLSVYYVCVWKSPVLQHSNDTTELGARRANHTDYANASHIQDAVSTSGGVNSTVSEPATEPSTPYEYESSSAGSAGTTNDSLTTTWDIEAPLHNSSSDSFLNRTSSIT